MHKDKDEETSHPSYGTIGWHRVSGQRENLFMSSLTHNTWVELEIRGAAKVRRDYHETVYHSVGQGNVVTVAMSEAQFAQFITSPNQGTGAPCTITRRGNTSVPQCPPDEQMIQFRKELLEDAKAVTEGAKETLKVIDQMLSQKTLKKGDLHEVRAQVAALQSNVEANMPFLVKQFNEYMDGVFHDAVAALEGHIHQRLESVGLEHLQNETKMIKGEDS